MIKRVIIGGLLGGLAMFIWGSVSHMVLGLSETAVKDLPNEGPITAALQAGIKEPGFYFFPAMELAGKTTKEEKEAAQKRWNEKYAAGPRGIVIFHPTGQQFNFGKRLALTLGAQFAIGIILALVLAQTHALRSYIGRLALVVLLGLLPFLMISFPYWNWYAFPRNFTIVELADRLLTIFCGGLVLAAVVKPASAKIEEAPAATQVATTATTAG
jgi:hypothetical protein